MTQEEKAFKQWLESDKSDLRKRGCKTFKDGIKTIYTDGYTQGRRDEFQDTLRTAEWVDQKFKEMGEDRIELLSQLAQKE